MTLPSADRLNLQTCHHFDAIAAICILPQNGPECRGVTKQEEGVCGVLASSGEVKDAVLRNLDLYSGSVQRIRRVSVLAGSILFQKVFDKTAV